MASYGRRSSRSIIEIMEKAPLMEEGADPGDSYWVSRKVHQQKYKLGRKVITDD